MKKIFTYFLLGLLALGFRTPTVATDINTGPLPEFCVKLEFSDKSVTGVEPSSWDLLVAEEDITIIDGDVIIKLFNFVFKDNEEIIGFSWEIKNAGVKDFTVKHGTTVWSYGTEFITTDRKGVSNAVWCLEELEEPPVEEPPVEEPDDEPEVEELPVEEPEEDEDPEEEEPPVDEEPEEQPEEPDNEDDDEEPVEPEDPIDPEDPEEPVEEEPCLECGGPEGPDEDDEPLPQTSDPISWASGILGLGSLLMLISKKKDA